MQIMNEDIETDELKIQSEIENIMEKVEDILKKIEEAYPENRDADRKTVG